MLSANTSPTNQTQSPKQKLYQLQDQITDPEVLKLQKEYDEAPDKFAFYESFESPAGTNKSQRDIFLLEKWQHYIWVRLAIANFGFQKQQLIDRAEYNNFLAANAKSQTFEDNEELKRKTLIYEEYVVITQAKKATLSEKQAKGEVLTPAEQFTLNQPILQPVYYQLAIAEAVLYTPAFPNTVAEVIQRDKINNVAITDSIAILRKICLQIVGTEHPTDPSAQEAHDILSLIANEFVQDKPSDEILIELLKQLQPLDPIPNVRREVHEEVSRDRKATAHRFYDNLPTFRRAIFAAYEKYYGADLAKQHESELWQALEGGLQPNGQVTTPIVTSATWTAGDAEGNPNVTTDASSAAVTSNRKEAAKKHAETIEHIRAQAKDIERQLRIEIPALHNEKFDLVQELNRLEREKLRDKMLPDTFERELVKHDELINFFQRLQANVSSCISLRNFHGLVELYDKTLPELKDKIGRLVLDPTVSQNTIIEKIHKISEEQKNNARRLYLLTLFSGSYHAEGISKGRGLIAGALGRFQAIFDEISIKVGDDKNSNIITENNLESVFTTLNTILLNHNEILTVYPDIKEQLQDFRLQLACFGMSLGFMHSRQDSKVYMRVWHILLADLKITDNFIDMDADAAAAVMNKLLDNSADSNQYFSTIYNKWKSQEYAHHKEVSLELDRMELALLNPDVFEICIMSNTKNLANLLALLALKKIFPYPNNRLHVVPLLENLSDLKISPELIESYIRVLIIDEFRNNEALKHLVPKLIKASNKTFQKLIAPHLGVIKKRVQVMFGYSDSARGSGLSVLPFIAEMREIFINLANAYGIDWRIFDGAGGDPFRGGPQLAQFLEMFTGQGNYRDFAYGTAKAADNLRQHQFASIYKNRTIGSLTYASLPSYMKQRLTTFVETSATYFENFLNTEDGLGCLTGLSFGWGPMLVVKMGNQSSRGDKRALDKRVGLSNKNHSDPSRDVQTGSKDNEGFEDPAPLRAIAASQLYEMLAMYMHIIIGPGHAMRALDANAKLAHAKVKSLYFMVPAFQDVYEKMLFGLANVNLDIAFNAYFGHRKDEFRPANEAQRLEWLAEAKNFSGHYPKKVVEDKLKTEQGKEELLKALSRWFVLVEDEFTQTRQFLADTNKLIHAEKYKYRKLEQLTHNTDLIYHDPELAAHIKDVSHTVSPQNWLLARICNHLARNEKLDWVFNVSKDDKVAGSKLNIIARVLGDIIKGITDARIPTLRFDVQRPVRVSEVEGIDTARTEMELIEDKYEQVRLFAKQHPSVPKQLVAHAGNSEITKGDIQLYPDHQQQHNSLRK